MEELTPTQKLVIARYEMGVYRRKKLKQTLNDAVKAMEEYRKRVNTGKEQSNEN